MLYGILFTTFLFVHFAVLVETDFHLHWSRVQHLTIFKLERIGTDISWVLSLTLLICYLKVLCQWHVITNAQCSAFVRSVNLVAAKQWESQKERELESRLNRKAYEVSNWLILNQGLTVFTEMNWFVKTYECREALKKIKLEV